jgi:hypothetical protein
MRKSAQFGLAALAVLAMTSGTASAQVVDDYDDAPRAYRYGPEDSPRVVVPRVDAWGNVYTYDRPFGRNGCGTYRFWNGERCVDARYR